MDEQFQWIELRNVWQNNLKGISLRIPRNRFIAITGVSGSGKSSLVFDVIHAEGRRKYLENLNLHARLLSGKLEKPKADEIHGLTPTLALSQTASGNNPRSTVGTLSETYDYLRLLFARLGKSSLPELHINQSLFSFNTPSGACTQCKGLGVEDQIDPKLLIADPRLSIRDRAFKITNPKGYIIYSQVTIDALNEVCQAHGFSVDIPWNQLSAEQQHIVLYGSDIKKIPYGKHTLESRMRWSGITAKPREEGYYKGIVPVMNQILQHDRNTNILRFARTQHCSVCEGSRLSDAARSVLIHGKSIVDLTRLSLGELAAALNALPFSPQEKQVATPIISKLDARTQVLCDLGLAYLSLNRQADTLSGGEIQRIRLARLINSRLRNITFIFDEPSVGVHPANNSKLIGILRQLVANGNTALVVEHDAETILQADWIIEIGPKAGVHGGELMFNGTMEDFRKSKHPSLTRSYLLEWRSLQLPFHPKAKADYFQIQKASINNLQNLTVSFALNRLNCVSGVSGAGKSSLIKQSLVPLARGNYDEQLNATGNPALHNDPFKQLIFVDRSPIGKNARSTPSTYTKLQDRIRDVFAALPQAKKNKLSKSSFSFNSKAGCCTHCEGAGKIEVGMHFLGNVETTCPVCNGKRYHDKVLSIAYQGKNIAEILDLSVDEALPFFEAHPKIHQGLEILQSIGLGYVRLGQSSGSLSGGEAQRIKLATEIIRGGKGPVLYVFDEPTTGLHFYDIQILLNLFARLLKQGDTIVVIEHHPELILNSQHVIDLGNLKGTQGGELIYEGATEGLMKCTQSLTGQYLKKQLFIPPANSHQPLSRQIRFTGIKTHNLKAIDVAFDDMQHTVITGKSGSGKSSLAFDTVFAEAQNRFTESFPAYIRRFTGSLSSAKFSTVSGLTPALALRQGQRITDPRSTLGTLTEISESYRLLFARFGNLPCKKCGHLHSASHCPECGLKSTRPDKASDFSFNNADAACLHCSGLGTILTSHPDLLIAHPQKSIETGGFHNHKSLQFYTDPFGQYMATLRHIGEKRGIDFSKAIQELSDEALRIAVYGSGAETHHVEWHFNRKGREGNHSFTGKWQGFNSLLLDEYYRKHANGKGDDLLAFLNEKPCPDCQGRRFRQEILDVKFAGLSIFETGELSVSQSREHFQALASHPEKFQLPPLFGRQHEQILHLLDTQFESLEHLGLGYLQINRQSKSLSGGELQRVLLSSHLKGGLCGLTYVLDEPSTGLHPADVEKLNTSIGHLIKAGNSVITVEHNPEVIAHADRVLELGPDAGENGGFITRDERPKKVADYFTFDKTSHLLPEINEPVDCIQIRKASVHNLKGIDPSFKINALNVVSGVSGSGKTTLMRDVLIPSYYAKAARNCESISGLEKFDRICWIDKQSLKGNVNSTPATFTGIFDEIRKCFAQTDKAREQKLKAGDFSFNSKSGQCPVCKGQGYISVKLDFIPDVEMLCESCHGQRFQSHILEVKYRKHSIADVLNVPIAEAEKLFRNVKSISAPLQLLSQLGLGYLQPGQSAASLSGGEAQRLKIAREVLRSSLDNTLFIFDEPSRGLHPSDIGFLIRLFSLLLEKGNTVIAIEHNPLLIAQAHHVVDLGPGGGEAGGELLFEGKPEALIRQSASPTGNYLKGIWNRLNPSVG